MPGPSNTGDDLDPTNMVQSYLRSKGLQPTSENVRRVLEQNARSPGTISGLVNNEPPDANSGGSNAKSAPAAKKSAAKDIEGSGNGADREWGARTDASIRNDAGGGSSAGNNNGGNVAASGGGGSGGYLSKIASAIGLGGAASLPWFMMRGQQPSQEFMGNMPMPPTGRTMDVNPDALGAPDAMPGLPAPTANAALPAPDAALRGPQQGPVNWAGMGDPQLAGSPAAGALPAPAPSPAISMPNSTSGPTIPLSDQSSTISPVSMGGSAPKATDIPLNLSQRPPGMGTPLNVTMGQPPAPRSPMRVPGGANAGVMDSIIRLLSHAR